MLIYSNNFEEILGNHGEIQHVGYKYVGSKPSFQSTTLEEPGDK